MILVTGGAGYIGSHTVKELTGSGYQPVIYDNLKTGHRESIQTEPFIEADLADGENLRRVFQAYSIDSVIHFAAYCLVGESVTEPQKYFNNNVRNSIQLLDIMDEFNVKKIIFSSSAAVYGEPQEFPIAENHPCLPTNPYGETKLIFERVLQAFHALGKLNFISLRYFNAAGADPAGVLGEDHALETHLIPILLKSALSRSAVSIYGTDYDTPDGTCIRDYVHVTDLARAHVLALEELTRSATTGIYNLGNGNGYSVREVIETAERVTGSKIRFVEAPRRQGDPARLVASAEKIRLELGWEPKYPDLSTIIRTAWEWHRNHPKGYRSKGTKGMEHRA